MFKRNYSFFHHCLLSCRYVMFKSNIFSQPKWGHKRRLGGYGPFCPPTPYQQHWLDPIILFLIFKFKFLDFEITKFKFIDFAKIEFKFINNS